jgi:hypothetical protein
MILERVQIALVVAGVASVIIARIAARGPCVAAAGARPGTAPTAGTRTSVAARPAAGIARTARATRAAATAALGMGHLTGRSCKQEKGRHKGGHQS